MNAMRAALEAARERLFYIGDHDLDLQIQIEMALSAQWDERPIGPRPLGLGAKPASPVGVADAPEQPSPENPS